MAQEVETLEPLSVDQTNDQTSDPSPNDSSHSDPSLSRNFSSSRLNAGAPEFVPRSSSNRSDLQQQQQPRLPSIQQPTTPIHVFPVQTSPFGIPYQNYGAFPEHEVVVVQPQVPAEVVDHVPPASNGLSDEVCHKILNQVEYYFSDLNLVTTDHLIRFINKDPDGFVPISVVASFKKIKALVNGPPQLATVLRDSSKLAVSDDGKKVRRLQPLTDSDIEDLQSRIVVAENLPEDHSYQNLLRIFSVVGSVKTIRTCQPQNSNGGASATCRSSKVERKLESTLFSNKLHAFVEYETVELAEKAIAELNDEGNWRSGLRVRLLLKRMPKSAQARSKKVGHEGEGKSEVDDLSTTEQSNEKHSEDPETSDTSHEHTVEESNIHEKEGGPRRSRGRGRGKGRGRGQHHNHIHNHRGNHVGTPPGNSIQNEQPTTTKQPPGPRMPDGTRGFTMGRGKPIVAADTA